MEHDVPMFWKNSLDRIREVAEGVRVGKHHILGSSAGGRPIHLIEYGEKQDLRRQANFSSACSYRDPMAYASKTADIRPILLLVGATHGGEIEGVAALLNLIQVLETGRDFEGKSRPAISQAAGRFRILIIPCLNPDGRARVPFSIVSQVSPREVVYYKHGQWKDGTLSDYAQGFRLHPILSGVEYLGGYYNDGGVNLSADCFFHPMAVENRLLMGLADEEAPDMTLLLHTGCHRHGKLMQPHYIPGYMLEKILEFDETLNARFTKNGYGYYTLEEHGVVYTDHMKYPPKGFGMSSAIIHTCGGFCAVYESYEATWDRDDPYWCGNILDCHFLLFEQALAYTERDRARGPGSTGKRRDS